MTDIVDIARKRRALLAAEVARLDRFLRMAAALQKYEHGGYGEATGAAAAAEPGGAEPVAEPAAPEQPESLVIKGMAASILKAQGVVEAETPATADISAATGPAEASTRALAEDAPALAKRKAGGGFLDKALHFIGEEVRGQTVTVVPASEAGAKPAVVSAATPPATASTPAPAGTAAQVPATTVTATVAAGDVTPDHFHFADNPVDEPETEGSETDAAAASTADDAPAEKPATMETTKAAKVQDAPAPSPAAKASAGPPTGPRLKAGRSGSVDIHVGQKLRQRRWMIGMSRQQLGDAVGVGLDQIRNYEMGTERIEPDRLWQVAAALDVPMSYFFEEIEGQSTNDSVTAAVLSEAEARMALNDGTAIPAEEASSLVPGQVEVPKRAAS